MQWAALPRIVVHSKHVPEALYPRVYRAMDALVIPTHGEGWGRPQMEVRARADCQHGATCPLLLWCWACGLRPWRDVMPCTCTLFDTP